MSTKMPCPFLAVASVVAITSQVGFQTPAGTAFTYQGSLTDGGSPANGQYDLEFSLFADAAFTSTVAGAIPVEDEPVVHGLFTARVDFGVGVFNGDARWLQIRADGLNSLDVADLPYMREDVR